jgi:hypothetical protein
MTTPAERRDPRWIAVLAAASLAATQLAIALRAASGVRDVASVDTANYYVIARNLAEGRGLTDTVLWQFLAAPTTVERPAGDYWEVGWPLVLGTLMRVFGTSQHAAIVICACLSALLPVAAFAAAMAAQRRVAVAWIAGLLVCLQTRLLPPDVTPDVTLMYQITCLAALAAAIHAGARDVPLGRMIAAGAVIGLPMHVRGEGFVVALAALPCLPGASSTPLVERARRTGAALLGIALVGLPFWARDLVVFGHLVPPSRSLRLWMTRYDDLSRVLSTPSPQRFWAQGLARMTEVRWAAIRGHADLITRQLPWPLLVFAVAGAAVAILARPGPPGRARALPIPLFVLLSLLVPCLVVPLIANDGRFVMNVAPALCVLASSGIFAVADAIARLVRRRAVVLPAIAAGVWACAAVYRAPASFRTGIGYLDLYRRTPACLDDTAQLAPLHLDPHDVVLTDDPWRVAAVLDVAAVGLPADGPAAADVILDRYRPRFVLATTPPLRQLARRKGMRAVATLRDGVWYAVGAAGE